MADDRDFQERREADTPLCDSLKWIIGQYIKSFEEKHETDFDYFVGDDILGIAVIGDMYLNISDIIYDIDNELPKDLTIEWYWNQVEHYENDSDQKINLKSYAMGARFKPVGHA